jgi:hypothetical protein
MGHLLGDARVSTTDQQPQLQVDAHERTGCNRVFTETASKARHTADVERVLDQLRPPDVSAGQTASAAGAVSVYPAVVAAR